MKKENIAHIKKFSDSSWAHPHLLKDHLSSIAKLAEAFDDEDLADESDWTYGNRVV